MRPVGNSVRWGLQEKWASGLIGWCFYIVHRWLHFNYARASYARGKLIWPASSLVKDWLEMSASVCKPICLHWCEILRELFVLAQQEANLRLKQHRVLGWCDLKRYLTCMDPEVRDIMDLPHDNNILSANWWTPPWQQTPQCAIVCYNHLYIQLLYFDPSNLR